MGSRDRWASARTPTSWLFKKKNQQEVWGHANRQLLVQVNDLWGTAFQLLIFLGTELVPVVVSALGSGRRRAKWVQFFVCVCFSMESPLSGRVQVGQQATQMSTDLVYRHNLLLLLCCWFEKQGGGGRPTQLQRTCSSVAKRSLTGIVHTCNF